MRFHILSLPHTETTAAFTHCAYTTKARRFATMMRSLGHEVFLYAGEANDADVTEHVVCITREQQANLFGGVDTDVRFFNIEWQGAHPHWRGYNARCVEEIAKRVEKEDFICVIAGHCQKAVTDAFPANTAVEYGIGYEGVYTNHRVYESYAWMHFLYGKWGQADGRFYDAVIPNYYDPDEFEVAAEGEVEDYFLFMGRLIGRKGFQIACEATERLGARLVMAGQLGDDPPALPSHVEHVGLADVAMRKELMSKARGVFVPTQYIGPFEGVHAEALMSGTPVLTTDWGVFTETVRQGVDGYRCRTMAEFVLAAGNLESLDRELIRARAISRFSVGEARWQYQAFFSQLMQLWGEGFYAANEPVEGTLVVPQFK